MVTRCITILALLLLAASPVHAENGGKSLFARNSIWRQAQRETGVPANKIYAIALQESGIAWQDGKLRPWPWTINSPEGPRRFNSKKEAYAEIKRLLAKRIYNIDIGMMQVNLYYHWDKINGVDILEPATNLKIASQVLKEAMLEANADPDKAAGIYHAGARGSSLRKAKYENSVERFEIAMSDQYRFTATRRRNM